MIHLHLHKFLFSTNDYKQATLELGWLTAQSPASKEAILCGFSDFKIQGTILSVALSTFFLKMATV